MKAILAYAGKEDRSGKVCRVGVLRHAMVGAPRKLTSEAIAAVGTRYDLTKVKRVPAGADGEG